MKNLIKLTTLIILAFVLFLNSCKDDKKADPIPTETKGTLSIEFDHVWAMSGASFSMNTMLFHPMTSDSLSFTKLQYYVSNVQLKKSDGTWWICPESYYFIDLSKTASLKLSLTDIPSGSYTEMNFTMGVDSLRNVSGAQTGALSTANGMFWDWNSGYIMLKAEGMSPNSSSKSFVFHLGGFKGVNNIVTQKNTNFGGANLVIGAGLSPTIGIKVNPARLWHSSPSVSRVNMIQMPSAAAKKMAKDFYDDIVFSRINP